MEDLKDKQYIENMLKAWEISVSRRMMFIGEAYYLGFQDILHKKRTSFDENGKEIELHGLVNSKIVDNQYSKLVDQKVNYLVGRPLTYKSDDSSYIQKVKQVLNKGFHKKLKNTTENALNNGVGWMHPYYENGKFKIKCFEPTEILPIYKNKDKEDLVMVIRLYKELIAGSSQTIEKVEVYKPDGIDRYVRKKGVLTIEALRIPYIVYTGEEEEQAFNWEKLPFIPFRYNQHEVPLISRVKSIQDAINSILSAFQDNMAEDQRKTLLVLVNYDGQDLEEFVKMKQIGAIKVSSNDGIQDQLLKVNKILNKF